MRKSNQNMLQGPMAWGLLMYTIPIICTSVLQLLFNAADLVVVGRYCGSISVAAVGSTGALTNLMVNLFIGLSVGAGVSVAHAIGSREEARIHRTVHTAIPTAIAGGLLLTAIGVTFSEPLLVMMGTPQSVLVLSAVYMRIFFGGMVFNILYNFCASILRAAGDTRSPLVILTGAGVLNVVLNIIFVTAFRMNVAGVALATVISQGVSAMLALWVLHHRTDACRLELKKMRFYRPELEKILRIGLPAGIQSSMFSLSNVLIQASVNSFGAVVMSGNAAVSNVEGFLYVTVNAFHQSALNYVGQNAGAGQYDRVQKTLRLCIAYVIGAGLLVGMGSFLLGPKILSLYITDSREAIGYGLVRMGFTCAPYFIYGIMDVITGALRGLGASFATMLITIAGVCGVRILWIYTVFRIPQYHIPQSLYISWPISWVFTLIAQLVAFIIVFRRQKARVQSGV